jgi:hypothetical protein
MATPALKSKGNIKIANTKFMSNNCNTAGISTDEKCMRTEFYSYFFVAFSLFRAV